ncbi:hypothetical protein M0812_07312 [Anaeramoeba flamelloides]|uniref:Trafficking protein particle complex subunit 13 C-terminal domain-containing protein n=1 Tax=Anaeramoeba flamelloides TaxID=1746091 RepID=A0AAV8A0I3_9EUKA|nr:hypothetical protein M0812_07312 [Anaeramoeba flamelloides]
MNNNEKNQTFSGKMHLCFKDQRKYLFQITPKEGFEEKAKRVTTIGKIIVNWQTKISSSKKIHTTNVPIKMPVRPEIEITIDKIPEDVILEQVFEVECRILNRTNDKLPVRLSYQYEKMKGILINGLSGVDLGEIEPFKPEIITIKMFPIFPGIQEIKGIVITNLINKQNFTIISPIKLVVKKN